MLQERPRRLTEESLAHCDDLSGGFPVARNLARSYQPDRPFREQAAGAVWPWERAPVYTWTVHGSTGNCRSGGYTMLEGGGR